MKRFVLALAMGVIFGQGAVADVIQKPAPVVAATVFPQGALVTRQVVMDFETAGNYEIALALPPHFELAPRFTATGARIANVRMAPMGTEAENYFTPDQRESLDLIQSYAKMLDQLEFEAGLMTSRIAALEAKEEYLRDLSPRADVPLNLEQLQAMADYLPKALADNAAEIAQIRQQLAKHHEIKDETAISYRAAQKAFERLSPPNQSWTTAQLVLNVEAPGQVMIHVDNFTSRAGWAMAYDLHLDEDDETITMERRAELSQQTGEHWGDVEIILSSARPLRNVTPNMPQKDIVAYLDGLAKEGWSGASYRDDRLDDGLMIQQNVTLRQEVSAVTAEPAMGRFDGVAVTYAHHAPITIASSHEVSEHITLAPLSLPVEVGRYASPRWDDTAFVRASLNNQTGEPILSGSARFFRDGVMIGHSHLAMIANGAETDLHFGPDDTLPLEIRFLSQLNSDTGFIARTNEREEILEFEVTNLGTEARDVTLAYALPVSEDEDLQVKVASSYKPDESDVDGIKGLSEWYVTLAPGERRVIKLRINISWPEGSVVDWQP